MRSPRRPRPFFFVALIAALAALATGLFAVSDAAPVFALRSNALYRLEVGGVVFLIVYGVLFFLYLAWRGQAPKQVGGGPMTVEMTPQQVDAAPAPEITMPSPDEADGGRHKSEAD